MGIGIFIYICYGDSFPALYPFEPKKKEKNIKNHIMEENMKRTFAILLVVAMLAAFCVVFASAEEKEIIDLMPTSADAWVVNGGFQATDITITVADGKTVFQGNIASGTDWPSCDATVSASVKAEDYSLRFDFDIEAGAESGNPRGALSFNASYAFGNDVIKPALKYDHTGEDFYTDNGHYALTI